MSRSLGDLAHLTAQQSQLLSFGSGQWRVGFAATQGVSLGLAYLCANAGFVTTEFLGKLNGFATNANQFDHLLAKLGRIRASSLIHL